MALVVNLEISDDTTHDTISSEFTVGTVGVVPLQVIAKDFAAVAIAKKAAELLAVLLPPPATTSSTATASVAAAKAP